MARSSNYTLLKFSLVFFALLSFIYGIGYLFFPARLVELSGGDPVPDGWLRWSGAILLGLSIGGIIGATKPRGQDTLVVSFALATLFCGLALLYNWFFNMVGDTWFTALPAVLVLISSFLLWMGRARSKDFLQGKEEQ